MKLNKKKKVVFNYPMNLQEFKDLYNKIMQKPRIPTECYYPKLLPCSELHEALQNNAIDNNLITIKIDENSRTE